MGRELNILFWNLCNKDLSLPLAKITLENQIDIVIVVEASKLDKRNLLRILNSVNNDYFDANVVSNSRKVFFFTKFYPHFIIPISEDSANRYSIRSLTLPKTQKILIGGVHLIDQKNYSKESRLHFSSIMKQEIDRVEIEKNISKTIIIGDFNMNPFEAGLANQNGLNASSTRSIANKISRKILSKEYSYFYNPSWSLMGDLYNEPSGTHYYSKSGYDSLFWNLFDQAIIRPDLIANFDNKSYQIITKFQKTSLLNSNGIPDKTNFSDHLPITLKLVNL